MAIKTVKFMAVDNTPRGGKDYTSIVYQYLTGNYAGVDKRIGNFPNKLSNETKALLKSAKAGDTVYLETAERLVGNNKYIDLVAVSSHGVADIPTSATSSSSTSNTSKVSTGYDTTGVKVGAARNQAIAFLAATKGTKFSLQDVTATAYQIVKDQQEQEDNVRSGIDPTKSPSKSASDVNTDDDGLDY